MTIREAPASMGQRVLWQMDHHRGALGALNCPVLLRLHGPLDVRALQASLDELARRHEALRTTFAGRGHRLTQLIHDEPPELPIAEVDLGSEEDPERAVELALAQEVQTRTDPAERPVRATLWRLEPEEHVLCVNMHHLVTDGWSCAVVANELGRVYGRLVAGGPELPPVGWQYAEWAEWHRRQLAGESLRRLQGYWRRRLRGAKLPALPRADSDLPWEERRTTVERVVIGHDVVEALQQFARGRATAFFTTMLAVYYALLRREVGDGDLAIGSIFANRTRREAQHTVGFLSNMVVLRTTIEERATFADLVAAADDAVIGAFAHQELPFQMLPLDTIDAASMRPDAVVFQLLAGPMARATAGGLELEPIVDVPEGIGSRWEFELSLAPADGDLVVLLCYARDLYDADWARRFVSTYADLAAEAARDPAAPLASLAR